MVKKMEMDAKCGSLVKSTQVCGEMIKDLVKANQIIQMVIYMNVSGRIIFPNQQENTFKWW